MHLGEESHEHLFTFHRTHICPFLGVQLKIHKPILNGQEEHCAVSIFEEDEVTYYHLTLPNMLTAVHHSQFAFLSNFDCTWHPFHPWVEL